MPGWRRSARRRWRAWPPKCAIPSASSRGKGRRVFIEFSCLADWLVQRQCSIRSVTILDCRAKFGTPWRRVKWRCRPRSARPWLTTSSRSTSPAEPHSNISKDNRPMALHLNLLHEEILEQKQRQRDPLKIGMIVLAGFGALLLLYYMFNAYRTLEIRSRLNVVQRNWTKIEPEVTTAQKRVAELEGAIKTARALDDFIGNRFFWAPLLQKVSRCVSPNTQLTSLEGNVLDENKGISVSIEGTAAGNEPRSVAEDFRQELLKQ